MFYLDLRQPKQSEQRDHSIQTVVAAYGCERVRTSLRVVLYVWAHCVAERLTGPVTRGNNTRLQFLFLLMKAVHGPMNRTEQWNAQMKIISCDRRRWRAKECGEDRFLLVWSPPTKPTNRPTVAYLFISISINRMNEWLWLWLLRQLCSLWAMARHYHSFVFTLCASHSLGE